MTDLEICKRIAEIENKTFEVNHWGDVVDTKWGLRKFYNPLTDDALCFKLMVKHNIKLSRNRSEEFVAMYTHCRGEESQNPQRAICLAIIEAHKG